MKRIALIPALLLLLTSTAASDEITRTIDAATDGNVSISNVAGSVEVIGWSRNEVQVIANLGRGVEELVVERDGDDVIVQVKVPRENDRHVSSELVIRLPANSNIEVGVVSADIEISSVLGEQNLNAVSGDITTEAYEADVAGDTVSGDIEVAGNGGNAVTQFGTVSGDIDAIRLAGEIEVDSVSGDIAVGSGAFTRVKAKTVNGDIAFGAALLGDGRFDAESINGGIDIDFEGDVSARFDIESFNGFIRNCFGPEPKRSNRYGPGRELKFTEGSGTARVTIHTLNGNLNLCKD